MYQKLAGGLWEDHLGLICHILNFLLNFWARMTLYSHKEKLEDHKFIEKIFFKLSEISRINFFFVVISEKKKFRRKCWKIKLKMIPKKYVLDLAIQFLTVSISRPMVLTETNHQRGSYELTLRWNRLYLTSKKLTFE